MEKTGLVIEGGGLRGLFATGVLDLFLEKNISFPYINAVSFGSISAFSYIARQMGRTKRVVDNFINDPRYMSFRNLIREGNLFSSEFVYRTVPEELAVFDKDAFLSSKSVFNITVTNCSTGEAEYLEKGTLSEEGLRAALRASASLPFLSKMVKLNGSLFLDGGLADSIPIKKAVSDGYRKNIIILTRDKGYRKSPGKLMGLVRFIYRRYPKIAQAIENRHRIYNETLDYIDELEKKGDALVIRPEKGIKTGRLERDLKKLDNVYRHGIETAKARLHAIKDFITEP